MTEQEQNQSRTSVVTWTKTVFLRDTTNKTWEIVLALLLASLAAFLIGWMIFGWYIVPVEWESPPVIEPDMNGVVFRSKASYVFLLQEWYAYSGDDAKFQFFASELQDLDAIACYLARHSTDFAEEARLIRVAYNINGYGCME